MNSPTTPLTIPTDVGDIEIYAEEGRIHLDASAVTPQCGTAFLDQLLEQAVLSNAVDSVSLNRELGTATIGYDASRWELPQALSGIAAMLDRGWHEGPDRSEVSLNLTLIPGVVTRVDRVRSVASPDPRDGGGLKNWLSSLSPFGRRARRGKSPAPRQNTKAVMQGIIIHYAPVSSDAADEPSLEGDDDEPDADSARDVALIRIDPGSDVELSATPSGGWRRAANLAAAGGCFALAIIGFVTPGIPTLPFVLATSHFLVRSTPALNERLRESRLFGAIVRDWEDEGGMRQTTKIRTILVMLGLLGTTALLSGGSVPVLMMTSAVGGIDLLVILAIPTIAEETAAPTERLLEHQPLVA